MADPTASRIAQGESASASTQIDFSAVAAGTLLVLAVGSDDYKSGDPSGWTLSTGCSQQTYLGHYVWWKIAAGNETSVTYAIGSATVSCYNLLSFTNVEGTSSLDISNGQNTASSDNTYTTPSVSTSSGRRLAVASMGASHGTTVFTGMSSWLNSYTELADAATTNSSGTRDTVGSGYLVFDGGGSTSSGVTYSQSAEARTGIVLVFKVVAGTNATVTPSVVAAPAAVNVSGWATRNTQIVMGGTSKSGTWT